MRKRAYLVTAAALLAACAGESIPDDADRGPAVDVSVVRVTSAEARGSYPAAVEALETAELSTRMSGTLERMLVDVGSGVRAGDTLAVLDGGDVRARIEAAAARAQLAQRTFERIEALASDGAASQQELDEARAGRDAAAAALRDARSQLAYTVLTAPFGGVVTSRFADAGDLALPGRPVLTLSGSRGIKAVADLPGGLAGSLSPGMGVQLTHPRSGATLDATVARVVPSLTPSSRRFRVELEIRPRGGDSLPIPGDYLRLHLGQAEDATWWVPADAVVKRGQLRGLYVLEGGTLRLRWVRTGQERGGAVEILAGPVLGRRVVLNPGAELRDGQPAGRVADVDWTVGGGADARSAEASGAER